MSAYDVLMLPEWYPWPHRPVLGSWTREQALALATRHNVVVLTYASLPVGGRLWSVSDAVEDGVRTVRVAHRRARSSRVTFLIRLAGLAAALRRLRATGFEPDVIHALVFSAGFAGLFLRRLCGAPLLVGEHYTGFPRGTIAGWDRAIAKLTFERADLVVPATHDLARHIAALGIDARMRQIANAIDTTAFAPSPNGAHRRGGVRMLNVASLDDKKGHTYLLQALADVRRRGHDVALDVAGDGPLRAALEREARELGLADAVRFLGNQPKERVAELMRGADFFVLPSLWENAPHVLMEAMASGTPSVATTVGGVAEIVDGETGVLVPPADAAALADAVAAMCDDHARYDPGRLARRAEERFGFEAATERWTAAYADVIAAAGRTARGSRAARPRRGSSS